MRHPWANIGLLILLGAQLASGFVGLISGPERFNWVLWLHGAGGYAVIVLLLWKGSIVFDAFRRRPRGFLPRLGFAALSVLLLAILGTGLVWSTGGPRYVYGFSLITIHVLLALGLLSLFVWHVVYMKWVFRVPKARDRRAFLRFAATTLGGLALWRTTGVARAALQLPGAKRRYTGSYERDSFSPAFPTVSWLLDNPPPVDVAAWHLVIDGAVLQPARIDYERLTQLVDTEITAVLDCTGGWYSYQVWTGVSVARLLSLAGVGPTARSVTFEAVSGYRRRFPLAAARSYLLATQVAGQPLGHGHGSPARLVALDQRGFNWVKWVTRIQLNESGHYWQLPVPLQ